MKNATNLVTNNTQQNSLEPFNTSDLVVRAQNGDESAFTELYSLYYPKVHRRVWHMVPTMDVEDVTQEVFLTAARALVNFRREAKFSTWLHTLTTRQIANYYRKRERRPEQADDDFGEFEDMLPQGEPQSTKTLDEMITVKACLARISPEYQEVILLRLIEGYKFKEIAVILDKTLDATKSLFRRALNALQQEIGTAYDGQK